MLCNTILVDDAGCWRFAACAVGVDAVCWKHRRVCGVVDCQSYCHLNCRFHSSPSHQLQAQAFSQQYVLQMPITPM